MGLYGSLFSGVSGLNSQSASIAALSDNIANINTVGYKLNSISFSTLLTSSSTSTSYSSGGVTARVNQRIDQQGVTQSTGITSDLAISGAGFFVVNEKSDGSGQYLYTRSGSFQKDARGNFINSAGYTLMAWPLDNNGRLPGETGNINTTSSALLDSLVAVNTKSISGTAAATTDVSLGINLNQAEDIIEGAGQTIAFPSTATANYRIDQDDVIVPESGASIGAGDYITVTPSNPGTAYNFTYGGVTRSNAITSSILGAITPTANFSSATSGDSFTITNATAGTVTFTYTPNSPSTGLGEFNNLNTLADAINQVSGLTARVQGNYLYIAPIDGTESLAYADVTGTFISALNLVGTNIVQSNNITSGILGAATTAAVFSGATNGDNFTITNTTAGTLTFTYQDPAPVAASGQFNSLTTLATAINTVATGIAATVSGNRLYITPTNVAESITFNDVAGTFASSLGLNDTVSAAGRFTTLKGLSDLIDASSGLKSEILNPLDQSSLKFYATDPLGQTTVAATAVSASSTASSILTELGLTASTDGPAYDPTGANAANMSSGGITTASNSIIRVYDAFGQGHDFKVSFAKIALNTWAAEVFALDKTGDIVTSRTDGQVAYGTVVFNGDGTLRSVSSGLTNPIDIVWQNRAVPGSITFNWGTAGQLPGTAGATTEGKIDGLRQLTAPYNVDFIVQNGVVPGLLTGVNVDKDGYVIANFSNGAQRKIFKIPLADFANPNGLTGYGNNVYGESQASGNFNLRPPGTGGVGIISPASLEQGNVELSDELTKMIVAQKGYQASSKVIKTVNEMLEELNRAFG